MKWILGILMLGMWSGPIAVHAAHWVCGELRVTTRANQERKYDFTYADHPRSISTNIYVELVPVNEETQDMLAAFGNQISICVKGHRILARGLFFTHSVSVPSTTSARNP